MSWPKTGATRAQLGLYVKGCAIKGLVVCNSWDVSAFGPTLKVYPYVVINRS